MERLLTVVCMSLYFIQELVEMDKSKDRICEVVMIDGCKVIMKYTQTPKPEVMDRVKDTLFNGEYRQQNAQEICNIL